MLSECLGDSSMHLGVSFIAPRQLRAVGGQQGRLSLPSVGWRTGQSGAPLDSHCRQSGADLFPFLAPMIVADSWQLAHRTLSGAHWTVRCPLPTVGADHASPADCAVDRCAGAVGSPDSPVNYSCTPPNFPREWPVHRRLAWRNRHCPVHHRTVRCTTGQSGVLDRAELWLYSAKSFAILSFPVSST
jgi:hypothetical protein